MQPKGGAQGRAGLGNHHSSSILARAHACTDHAHGLKDPHSLAHRGPGNLKLLGHDPLPRQPSAQGEVSVRQLLLDPLQDQLVGTHNGILVDVVQPHGLQCG
ncbi:hypothetical protein D3C73_1445590 [compost metagenome]